MDIANGEREKDISIHALLTESDDMMIRSVVNCINISIHALLTESDASRIAAE